MTTNLNKNKEIIALPKGYVLIDEATKKIGVSTKRLRKIYKTIGKEVETLKHGGKNKNIYKESDLQEILDTSEKFLSEHVDTVEARKKYSEISCRNVQSQKVPPYILTSSRTVYNIEELERYEYSLYNDYYTYDEALEKLNITKDNLIKTLKELNIKVITLPTIKKSGILKKDIDSILEKQNSLLENALTYDYVYSHYGAIYTTNLNSFELPSYARKKDDTWFGRTHYYNKKIVEQYHLNKTTKFQGFNAESDTSFNTYLTRLNIRGFSFTESRPYTVKKLKEFVNTKLSNSDASPATLNSYINKYITWTVNLFDYLDTQSKLKDKDDVEIYSLKSSEINLYLKNSGIIYAEITYDFLKVVAQDILLNISTIKGRGFNFNKIKNPNSMKDNVEDKGINSNSLPYNFQDFMCISNFLTDINMHKLNISNLKTDNKKMDYLSMWLYLVLYLTNAWRNNDVSKFPRVNFDLILDKHNINSIDWLFNNELTTDVALEVVLTVDRYIFIMNKNKAEAKFRTSENIAVLTATILLMLELYHKTSMINTDYNSPVMTLGGKFNKITNSSIDVFMKDLPNKSLKVRPRRLNKSIMSYSKIIAPMGYDLLLPKYQRSHNSESTTAIYTKLTEKQMDDLCVQLFSRGEFGFIYDTLVDLITGNTEKKKLFKKRTELIKSIKNSFGDYHKIESTVRLSNYYDEIEIIDLLYDKGIDECCKILNDIYLQKLPSKEDDIQCLYSKSECKHPERHIPPEGDGCVGCNYAIPSIFILNSLSDRLKNDFNSYSTTNNIREKRRISMRIEKSKSIIRESIQKFGMDFVYSTLGIDMSRNEFRESISNILDPDEVLEDPLGLLLRQ